MKSALALTLVSLLSACTTTPYSVNWIPPKDAPKIVYKYYTNNQEQSHCASIVTQKLTKNSVYIACTEIVNNVCTLHLPENASDFIIAHELLHCSGWQHTISHKH